MKLILGLAIVFLSCAPSYASGVGCAATGSIAVQCADSGGQAGATSFTATFTNAPANGHTVIVAIFTQSNATTVTGVVDSNANIYNCGNTFTASASTPKHGATTTELVYIASNVQGGCSKIVATINSSSTGDMKVFELPSSTVECDGAGTGTGTTLTSGACSPTSASSILFAAMGILTGSDTFTPGASYAIELQRGGGSESEGAEDRQVASTASYSASATVGSSGEWDIIMVALIVNPVISGTTAVIQGGTINFTETASEAGTWSCSGCAGSIGSSTGVYTAPSSVTAQQTIGGYQFLPNNHIFNVNVASFPLRTDSSSLIGSAGSADLALGPDTPINYVNGSTPTTAMVFNFTPQNNANFQVPAFPGTWPTGLKIQGGWLSAQAYEEQFDHHLLTIDTTTGNLGEIYQFWVPGDLGSCPSCNSDSGIKYGSTSYALPASGATNAAATFLMPLTLRLQEYEEAVASSGTIKHALACALPATALTGNPIWPAWGGTEGDTGLNPYGARWRLKAAYDISGFTAAEQIILVAMKNYGLFITDGGGGQIGCNVEATKFPVALQNALVAISNAGISASNFEVVDETGQSGGTNYEINAFSGECNCNRETVTFTRTSDSVTASVEVVPQGVAINFPYDIVQMQVGAAAYQLSALANTGSVTWSMSPTLGTLSGTGLYTPPGSASVPAETTITATSTVDATVSASLTLQVFPAGVIRLVPGSLPGGNVYAMNPTNYTDSLSNVWYSTGDDGGYSYDEGMTISGTPDPTLYRYEYDGFGGQNDSRYDVLVPNGTYTVVYKAAATSGTTGTTIQTIEINGTDVSSNLDLYTAAGGLNKAYDATFTGIAVTNHVLSIVMRAVNNITQLGSLQISQTSGLGSGLGTGISLGKNAVIQ